jgi:hypothetical protein
VPSVRALRAWHFRDVLGGAICWQTPLSRMPGGVPDEAVVLFQARGSRGSGDFMDQPRPNTRLPVAHCVGPLQPARPAQTVRPSNPASREASRAGGAQEPSRDDGCSPLASVMGRLLSAASSQTIQHPFVTRALRVLSVLISVRGEVQHFTCVALFLTNLVLSAEWCCITWRACNPPSIMVRVHSVRHACHARHATTQSARVITATRARDNGSLRMRDDAAQEFHVRMYTLAMRLSRRPRTCACAISVMSCCDVHDFKAGSRDPTNERTGTPARTWRHGCRRRHTGRRSTEATCWNVLLSNAMSGAGADGGESRRVMLAPWPAEVCLRGRGGLEGRQCHFWRVSA